MPTTLTIDEMKAKVQSHFDDFVNNRNAKVIQTNMTTDFYDHDGPSGEPTDASPAPSRAVPSEPTAAGRAPVSSRVRHRRRMFVPCGQRVRTPPAGTGAPLPARMGTSSAARPAPASPLIIAARRLPRYKSGGRRRLSSRDRVTAALREEPGAD